MAHVSWWNGLVVLIWLAVQITCIQHEELPLGQDAQFQRYAQQVRWRVLPGVW